VPHVWDLITDNNSMEGKLVTTAVIVAIAIVVGTLVGRVWSRRIDDRYRKYYARKIVHYVVVAVTLIGLGILWRPFAGQLGLVLGLMAAGIAVGLQDLIGSLAGWPILLVPEAIVGAMLFAAAVGVFFGFYPALKASRLDPIVALRWE